MKDSLVRTEMENLVVNSCEWVMSMACGAGVGRL